MDVKSTRFELPAAAEWCLSSCMKQVASLALLTAFIALVAHADEPPNYICTGGVDGVSTLPDGTVAVETFRVHTQVIGNGNATTVNEPISWVFLCNIKQDVKVTSAATGNIERTITPDVCKAWLSTLLLAQTTERSIALWFSTADGYGSCSALRLKQPSSSFRYRQTTFGPALRN